MAHMINLVVQFFFSLPIVACLKDLLQSIYTFFCKSQFFCYLEFIKLAQIMETKGNKLLCDIRTQWINMLSPLKCMLEDYCHLLMKMVVDSIIVALTTSKLD
jgi:hypothetical protein